MNTNLIFENQANFIFKNVVGDFEKNGFTYGLVSVQNIVDNVPLGVVSNIEHLQLSDLHDKILETQSVVIEVFAYIVDSNNIIMQNIEIPFEFKMLKTLSLRNYLAQEIYQLDIPVVLKISERNINSYTLCYNRLNNYLDTHIDFSTYHIYNKILETSNLVKQYFSYSINSASKLKISSLVKTIRYYFPQKQDIEILLSLDTFLKVEYLKNKLDDYTSQNDYLEHNLIVSDNISNYLIIGISKYKNKNTLESEIHFFNKNTELIDELFNKILDKSYILNNIKNMISINKNNIKDKICSSEHIYNVNQKGTYIDSIKNKSTNFEFKSIYNLFELICDCEKTHDLDISNFTKDQYLEIYNIFEPDKIETNIKILYKYISFCGNSRALLDFQSSYKEKFNVSIDTKKEKLYYNSQEDMAKAIKFMVNKGFENKQITEIEHLIFLIFAPKFSSGESSTITKNNYLECLENIYCFTFNGNKYCLTGLYDTCKKLVEYFINNYNLNSDILFTKGMYSQKYKSTLDTYYEILNDSNTLPYIVSEKMKSKRNTSTQINYFKLELLQQEYDKSFLIENLNDIIESRSDTKVRKANSKYKYYNNFENWLENII